ncbi:MAG: hypothetical protein ACPK7O_06390 [Methanobacterium sp.]
MIESTLNIILHTFNIQEYRIHMTTTALQEAHMQLNKYLGWKVEMFRKLPAIECVKPLIHY